MSVPTICNTSMHKDRLVGFLAMLAVTCVEMHRWPVHIHANQRMNVCTERREMVVCFSLLIFFISPSVPVFVL